MIPQEPLPPMSPLWGISAMLFSVGLFLSVSAVNLTVSGTPVRAVLITLAMLAIMVAEPNRLISMMLAHRKLLGIIGLCALLGLFASLLNGAPPWRALMQLVEIHLQAIIGLLIAASLVDRLGTTSVLLPFILIWSLSGIVALAQALGLDFAWQMREWFGDWMNDPPITRAFYEQQRRAVGISFSPVHLATQTCLTFAAFFAWRVQSTSGKALRTLDGPLLVGLGIAILVCAISGNRSPLLGFAFFLTIYVWIAGKKWRAAFVPLLLLILLTLPLLQQIGQTLDLRIASSDDGSAIGRSTLLQFGLFLLAENPLGYGLLFKSTDHASSFAHHAIHMDNPDIIRHFTLHNYYLLMLGKYGVVLLFLVPWIMPRGKFQLLGWIGFVPYLIHIAFHNEGPLSSDFLIWLLLPAFLSIFGNSPKSGVAGNSLVPTPVPELAP